MTQNSNRGYASMDRNQRRRISSMGGRSSQGGRNESWKEDYDDRDYDDGYEDEDDDYDTHSSYDDNYDDRDYNNRRGGYDSDYYESDYDYEGGRSRNYGRSNSGNGNGRSSNGNRSFGSMDRDDVRHIAGMGGRAAHERGTAHEWDSEEARKAGHRGGMWLGRQSNSGRSSGDYDYDDNYNSGRSRRGRSSDYDNDDNYGGRSSGGGRGFASMDRDEVRRMASMGRVLPHSLLSL